MVLNVAMTLLTAVMVTVHVAVIPEHAPDHPPNSLFAPALAVKVTLVFGAYCWSQSTPQVIPGPEVDTVPVPVPFLVTVSAGHGAKVAVTSRIVSTLMSQVTALPWHAPLQPANV